MFQLTQRQINYGVFGLTTGLTAIALVFVFFVYPRWNVLASGIAALVFSSSLWFAYWRGWDQARHTLLVLMTLVVAIGTDTEFCATTSTM